MNERTPERCQMAAEEGGHAPMALG